MLSFAWILAFSSLSLPGWEQGDFHILSMLLVARESEHQHRLLYTPSLNSLLAALCWTKKLKRSASKHTTVYWNLEDVDVKLLLKRLGNSAQRDLVTCLEPCHKEELGPESTSGGSPASSLTSCQGTCQLSAFHALRRGWAGHCTSVSLCSSQSWPQSLTSIPKTFAACIIWPRISDYSFLGDEVDWNDRFLRRLFPCQCWSCE